MEISQKAVLDFDTLKISCRTLEVLVPKSYEKNFDSALLEPIVAEYIFKTIYFPRERVRGGSSARITISIPTNHGTQPEFVAFVSQLSSRDFRLAIGNPYVEDLETQAQREGRSFSNLCMRLLFENFSKRIGVLPELRITMPARSGLQLSLPFIPAEDQLLETGENSYQPSGDLGVTFRDSLRQAVFGWYPYVEGFSASYTRDAILRYQPRTVYDPFGGSGTTQLAAACLGVPSFYSEVNPFMCFVAETKVTASRWARANLSVFKDSARAFTSYLTSRRFSSDAERVDLTAYEAAFPQRDFFEERHIRELLSAVSFVREYYVEASPVRDILLLACASNAVRSSNMTRRADLRRRRTDEYKNRVVNVPAYLSETVARYVENIEQLPTTMAATVHASVDARDLKAEYSNVFDFALTSPPYLNGTNYFRNTKIELWLLGFIKTEDELGAFRSQAISAGINNVTRGRKAEYTFDRVEAVVEQLKATDGDKRIPMLVRQYFSDMHQVFLSVARGLTAGGVFLLDIGDSKFYGVHVPTDRLLIDAATRAGLLLKHTHVLARRHSRDKSELVQVELVLEKPKRIQVGPLRVSRVEGDIERLAAEFQRTLPYKEPPYDKRNWGHDLHSLCSYQGKLKPSLAHWLVRHFVPRGGCVLDPLGGVATIPFEAALLGCPAVSNDKSPFAGIIGRAKLAPPTLEDAAAAVEKWWSEVTAVEDGEIDFNAAEFGLNGAAKDFFHEQTLSEVLRARTVFLRRPPTTDAEVFIWASLLHVLHGNRPYALSRTSHPITPFHPKGPAVYKSVREKVLQRVKAALEVPLPKAFTPGRGITGDFRLLNRDELGEFDAIITSPPFLGMRFDRPNWLRLWFCGWGESDFHRTSLAFLEREQTKSAEVYREFFATMRNLIAPTGVLIMHIGSGGRTDRLYEALRKLGDDSFRLRAEVRENVQAVEQHGIRDKGLTTHHNLLFFKPR